MALSGKLIEFTLIYNRHKAKVYNYVLKMVNDAEVCADIVQNVFMKLYENLDKIKNKKAAAGWLFRVARNEIFMHYRKNGRSPFTGEEIDDEIISTDDMLLQDEIELNEFGRIVKGEVENLPAEQREVYLLKEYGELSYKEIAEITGADINLIKSRLYNARQNLIKNVKRRIEG